MALEVFVVELVYHILISVSNHQCEEQLYSYYVLEITPLPAVIINNPLQAQLVHSPLGVKQFSVQLLVLLFDASTVTH